MAASGITRLGASWLVCSLALSGCAGGVTGLDAKGEYDCKAPKGVPCMSMSGAYANARGGAPSASATAVVPQGTPVPAAAQVPEPRSSIDYSAPPTLPTAAAAQPGATGRVSPAAMSAPTSGLPLRTPERILRIWVAAVEDAEGTLHDQRYLYVTVDRGQWQLETFQDAARAPYRPVTRAAGTGVDAAPGARATPNQMADEAARAGAAGLRGAGIPVPQAQAEPGRPQ